MHDPQSPATAAAESSDADRAPPPDQTGRTLGDFRLLRRLGQGGMGQVYLAEQLSLKRHVALKLLRPDLASNATSLARFKAEAGLVARATHANIVQIYAIGDADGQPYMALEYVEGKNLREVLEKKGPPELKFALRIMMQVADALQRAGELGIVHRDIKPENILLTRKGEVKVADFGLSRCFDGAPSLNLTQSGVTMGTPLYMSPEQVEGNRQVDTRSDIYSFGVTCYHMLVGHPPFKGNSPFEVALQHVQKDAEPLESIRPDLPIGLCNIVHKMMAKRPEDRYQTGREVVRDLARLRDVLVAVDVSALAVAAGCSPLAGLSGETLRASSPSLTVAPRSRLSKLLGVTAVAAALAVGWGAAYLREASRSPAPPAQAASTPEDPPPLFNLREREKELVRLAQEHLKPESKLDLAAGLKHTMNLGFFYLNERDYADAERFFKELTRPDQAVYAYRLFGQLGLAMVLAFKDEPAESNKLFTQLLADLEKVERQPGFFKAGGSSRKEWLAKPVGKQSKEEVEAYIYLWHDNPAVREQVARALEYNYLNAPAAFPPRLEPYRHPPRAVPPPSPVSKENPETKGKKE